MILEKEKLKKIGKGLIHCPKDKILASSIWSEKNCKKQKYNKSSKCSIIDNLFHNDNFYISNMLD